MLVEVPDVNVILAGLGIFLVGFFGIIVYFKVKTYVNIEKMNKNPAQLERLEYYERQLIDLKIRLDTIDLENIPESEINTPKIRQSEVSKPKIDEKSEEKSMPKQTITPISKHSDVINEILHTITDKTMTSRDIQITIGKTREHTSRLMKKISADGLVQRHVETKPYTYSLTEKGQERLKMIPMLTE